MKKNNRGFSLVELMMILGALGGVSLLVMNLSKQTIKSSAKLQFDTDVTLTTNEINGILSDPAKCLATLQTTATPASINNGKYYITSSASAPAQGYGNSGLMITSYTLTGTAPDGVLTILYQNKNILKGSSGAANISKKINLYIEGSPGAITKCRASSTSTTDIWSHGTGNDIFYLGEVGIGTTSPGYKLDVTGDIKSSGVIYTTSLQYTSDKRLKKNIAPIENALEKVSSLRGVRFSWKSNNTKDVGFIAQEVKKQIPEIVKYDVNRDVSTVDYARLVPFLVEAIKTQQEEINKLKNKINEMQR
ncbi:MAG: tail fiber domain-containing protein [Bacteriovoracaceae bacterium]|nr:tail fiber domain-containing protein [Bacteriovoracaceae bacterium]